MLNLRTAAIGAGAIVLVVWGLIFGLGTEQQVAFLPGTTSSGHHLFEASCQSCHDGFKPVSNDTCNRCHEAELVDDVHGQSKFRDLRWASYLEKVDILTCTTCHEEHMPMFGRGVNLPPDLCMSCHDHIADADSPDSLQSHVGFEPDGCWTAGCHNFHDHRSISTGFLRVNLDQPDWLPEPIHRERVIEPQVASAPEPDLNRELWGQNDG